MLFDTGGNKDIYILRVMRQSYFQYQEICRSPDTTGDILLNRPYVYGVSLFNRWHSTLYTIRTMWYDYDMMCVDCQNYFYKSMMGTFKYIDNGNISHGLYWYCFSTMLTRGDHV